MGQTVRWGISLLLTAVVAAAQQPGWRLDTEVTWHDNVTNGEQTADRLSALEWRSELRIGRQRALAGGHRIGATAGLRTEIWPRFAGLNAVVPGVGATWEFKPGLGPRVPVLLAALTGEGSGAQERARTGWGGVGRLQVTQRAGTNWLLAAGHDWRRFDARGRAFDRTGREWFARAGWTPGAAWHVAAEFRGRQGDVVSYSRPPRPDLVAIGKPVTLVDTFEQAEPWIAYYFQAKTRSRALELQHSLGRSTLTLRHDYRHTLHAGPGYKNRLTTLRFSTPF